MALGDVATRLPASFEQIDRRGRSLENDIAAMRAAVEPLDKRMVSLEREIRRMHQSLSEGMRATEDGMRETARLQQTTNEGIGDLVKGVDPLEGGIDKVETNTSTLNDKLGELRELMAGMLGELTSLRESLGPVSSAAEPIARLRERLPGGDS